MVDKQIGEILDALEKSGKSEDTVILFFADHGEGMAAHGQVTKYGAFYEESNRVPLLARGRGIPAGHRIQGVTSLLDILPTLLDYSGLPADGFAGRSQLKALTGQRDTSLSDYVAAEWYDEFRDYTIPGRMICDQSFKYICYGEPDSEELFDLTNDRLECRNLSHVPEYRAILDTYRSKLADHIEKTEDDFHRLAVSDSAAYRRHPLGYHHHEGLSAVEHYAESLKKEQ